MFLQVAGSDSSEVEGKSLEVESAGNTTQSSSMAQCQGLHMPTAPDHSS